MYAEYLKASGFRVEEARNGIEAVAKAREFAPDCILMDLSLPGIDGWEATRLKADAPTAASRSWDHGSRVGARSRYARAAGCFSFVLSLPSDAVAPVPKRCPQQHLTPALRLPWPCLP